MAIVKKHIQIPVYDTFITMLVGDFDEINEKYRFSDDPNICDAVVWQQTGKHGFIYYYVAFRDCEPNAYTIVHETVHLVNRILRDRGVKLDVWNDEHQAYFTGYLYKEITCQLNKLKTQSKTK